MDVSQAAQLISQALGARLAAVYQFGSTVAQGELGQTRLLVIVDQIDRALLDALSPAASHLQHGRIKLRLGTQRSLVRGADAFPAFSLEVLHTRQLLLGADVLAELRVEPAHLRLHVEQGLRALHRELVETYLGRQTNRELIRPLRQSTRKLIHLLEGAILAGGLTPPRPSTPESLISMVRSGLAADAGPGSWDTVQAFATRGGSLEEGAIAQVFDALLDAVQSTIVVVDAMDGR